MARGANREHDHVRDPDLVGGRPPVERVEFTQNTDLAAKIQPLDVTGVRTMAVGALIWLAGFVVLLPFHGTLKDHGRSWWLWTCLAGFTLGLIGVEYCRRRRRRLADSPERPVETSPLGAAGL